MIPTNIVHLQVVALLAFSTTAGFRTISDDNRINCRSSIFNNTEYHAVLHFQYPFTEQDFRYTYLPSTPPNFTEAGCPQSMPFQRFSGRSGYFVAMGVLSMIYVIAAIIVYMLFLIPDLFLVKWLVVGVSWMLCDSSGDPLTLHLPFLLSPVPLSLLFPLSLCLLFPLSPLFPRLPFSFFSSSSPLFPPSLLSSSTGLYCHNSVWCIIPPGRHFMVFRCCRFIRFCAESA